MVSREKRSISLEGPVVADVEAAVASGEYASAREVVEHALRQWKALRDEERHLKDELGALWDEGVASGSPRDGEEAMASIRELITTRPAS